MPPTRRRIVPVQEPEDIFPVLQLQGCPKPQPGNVIPKISARMRNAPKQAKGKQDANVLDLNKMEDVINSVVINESSGHVRNLSEWNQNAAALIWTIHTGPPPPGSNARRYNRMKKVEVSNGLMKMFQENVKAEEDFIELEKQFNDKTKIKK